MNDIDKKYIRNNFTISYYNPNDIYIMNTRSIDHFDSIDETIPMFYGSEKYGEKIIEVLETFGGNNESKWFADVSSYIYCVSSYNKSIICFEISEFSSYVFNYFEEKGLIMKIEDFLGIKQI